MYRCHEQISPSLDVHNIPTELVPICIDHYGYVDPQVRQAKLERNLRLILLDLYDYPGDYFILTHLALVNKGLGRLDEAGHYLEQAIRSRVLQSV